MTLTTFIIAIFAVWEILEIWHHSALFAGLRAYTELCRDGLRTLAGCMFCLAPWVAVIVVVCLANPWGLTRWPVYALAIARGANLANDLCHHWTRTPRYLSLSHLPDEEDDGGPSDAP